MRAWRWLNCKSFPQMEPRACVILWVGDTMALSPMHESLLFWVALSSWWMWENVGLYLEDVFCKMQENQTQNRGSPAKWNPRQILCLLPWSFIERGQSEKKFISKFFLLKLFLIWQWSLGTQLICIYTIIYMYICIHMHVYVCVYIHTHTYINTYEGVSPHNSIIFWRVGPCSRGFFC